MAIGTFIKTMKMNKEMFRKFDEALSQSDPLKNMMALSDSYRIATKDEIKKMKKVLNLKGQ